MPARFPVAASIPAGEGNSANTIDCGALQYTLGMCVNIQGTWNCSATIQFWYGRDLAASGLPRYIAADWWYDTFQGGYLTSSMWRARLWIPYLSLPVGMGLLSLQYVADIWALLTGREMPFGLKPEDKYDTA